MPDLDTLGRAHLEDVAGDYDIDPTGLSDEDLKAAILAAENGVDTTEEDEFEAGKNLEIHIDQLPKAGRDGRCPHCDRSTLMGDHSRVTEFIELSPGSQRDTERQYTCNSCAGEWGPIVDKPKKQRAASGSSNGLKIEANRQSSNGVTRPSIGGKCRAVWDMLDELGDTVTAKDARAKATELGFDKTTTMVQFYRWRKFNGIEGRQ